MRAADMSPEGAAPKRESRPAGTGATLENGKDSSPDSTCEGRGSQGPTVIRKNALEEIRVELSEYNGHDLINLRVWADPRNGGAERIPTGAGGRLQRAAPAGADRGAPSGRDRGSRP